MTTRSPRPRLLPWTAIFLGAASLILFGIIIAAMWVNVPDRDLQAVRAVAPTLAVVSTLLWIGGRNSRRSADISEVLAENNRVLIGTMGHVILPPAPAPARRASTGPLRAV